MSDTRKNQNSMQSKEVGDEPTAHDAMFNYVPGACFEIGTALSILDNPGEAGKLVDVYSAQVASILNKVFHDRRVGDKLIKLSPISPQTISLRDYFSKKILAELKPSSDQIGRCLDVSKDKDWFKGAGATWLYDQLTTPSHTESYDYKNMLTKIRTISVFGSALKELMHNCKEEAAILVKKPVEILEERNKQIVTQVRHENFDNPVTRARYEKMPIVEGKSLKSHARNPTGQVDKEGKEIYEPSLDIQLTSGSTRGVGFGQVYHVDEMKARNAKGEKMRKAYLDIEKKEGRQGMKRLGQDINDLNRPGLLGDSGMKMMPEAFKKAGLVDQLNDHQFHHGSGVNRWQLHGSYAVDSWDQDFPAAGVHSGGTSGILFAFNCLDKDSIFGKEKTASAGLLISSFMNFGGYHSFVETYPIIQAVANDSVFKVEVTKDQKNLYSEMLDVARVASPDASKEIEKYHDAYKKSAHELAANKETNKETDKKSSKDDFDITYSRKHSEKDKSSISAPDKDALATSKVSIDSPGTLVGALRKIGSTPIITTSSNQPKVGEKKQEKETTPSKKSKT